MAKETKYNRAVANDPILIFDDEWVSGESIEDEDYSPDGLDVSDFDMGSITVEWADYDGSNASINIQGSNDNVNWSNDGGSEGAKQEIDTASGFQVFRLTHIGYKYIRFRFYMGGGSEATISANYLFKATRA